MPARTPWILPLFAVAAGCHTDDGSPPSWTDTELSTTTTTTSTEGTGTTGEPEPLLDCPVVTAPSVTFTAPPPVAHMLDDSTVCAGIQGLATGGVTVEVSYTGDEIEDPADGRFPVVIFHHGNGLDYQQYGYLLEALQTSGFVVLNVTSVSVFSTLEATASMRCALRWFYLESSYFDEFGSCDVVVAGHSRGGLAAQALPAALTNMDFESDLLDLDVRAVVLLASAFPEDTFVLFQEYSPARAVPFLGIGSSTDGDVPGWVLTPYDLMAPESAFTPGVATPTPYKGAVWIYDLPHTAFGGGSPGLVPGRLSGSVYAEKGHAITRTYVDRFLRWQIFGDESQRPFFVGDALPPEVLEPDWWSHLVPYRGASQVCAAVQSEIPCTDLECAWTGSACQGTPSCAAFSAEQACLDAACLWMDDACQGKVPILQSFTLDTRQTGFRWIADLFEHDEEDTMTTSGAVSFDLGPVTEIIQGVDLITRHVTGGVLASVTSASPGASVTFATQPVGAGEGPINHASLRIGARTRVDADTPAPVSFCNAETEEPVPIRLAVSDGQVSSNVVDLDPVIQQDVYVSVPPGGDLQCVPQLFLHTQRVPMTELCTGVMLDLENIDSWTFSFPEGVPGRDEVVVDTLEFTQSTADEAVVGHCATQTAMWACEASTGLQPQRPVCRIEPTSGVCPSGSITYETLDVPEVPESWDGPFSGWVVHMPAGFSDDPWDPSSELVEAMTARCVAACEQQWSDDPTVDTGCDASGAFVDVSLLSTPSAGALRRISPLRTDGRGIFEDESLGCSLLDTCCDAFDEDLCRASPRRTTPASFPIGVGQEYVVAIDQAESKLEVTDGQTVSSVVLYGDVGFSRCRDGNDTGPCPFYLGSLSAKSIGSISIPITCPNQQVIHRTLFWLELNLAQPAMGIAQEGTDAVGFPAGALIFDANFTASGLGEMDVRGVAEVDVVGTAGTSDFSFGNIKLKGMMPACWGQDDIPVEGTFELVLDLTGGIEHSPPSIEIDIPSAVSCPSNVDLDAIVSDPDDDLDRVLWYIDDVLMWDELTSITFTQPHTVRAVAYDERGAATTAVKFIDCL